MNFWYYIILLIASIWFILIENKKHLVEFELRKNKLIKRNRFSFVEIFLILICISLIMICATRPVVGTYDTEAYVEYFDKLSNTPFFIIEGRFRLGFEYLCKILLLFFGKNYKLILGAIVLINCIIVIKALKNLGQQYGLSFILYVGFYGLYYNYIILRSGLANSFVILAYSYLEKNHWKVFACIIIATLLHESALIVLLVLCCLKLIGKLRRKGMYIILGLSVFFYLTHITDLLINNFLNSLYPHLSRYLYTYILYLNKDNYDKSISLYYLMCFILTALAIHAMTEDKGTFYRKMVYINVLGHFVFSLFSSNSIMGRVWDYMTPATFIYLIPNIYEDRKKRMMITMFVFLAVFMLRSRIVIGKLPFYF